MTLFEQATKETLQDTCNENKEYLLAFRFLCAVRKLTNEKLYQETEVNFHHDLYLEAHEVMKAIKIAKGE